MPTEPGVPDLPEGVKLVAIREQEVFDDLPFPLILSPSDDFKDKDYNFWNRWIKENLQTIESLLIKYGAILYRGFPIDNPTEFDAFAKAYVYGYVEYPYLGGIAIRVNIVGNVYTTSQSGPGCKIPFHHEMAYVKDYPLILFFYCDLPAKEGGDTPIALSNVVFHKMAEREPDFVKRLEKEGLRYVRVAPDGDDANLGRSWQSTFYTANKHEAEVKAIDLGYDFEWLEDGSMKAITEVFPAIRVDKRTGKKMFFNSVFTCCTAWQDARNDRTKAAIFPNGDTISAETIETLRQVMDEAKVSFTWQHKDVVMIDNRTVQHARGDFFVPPRRILASLFKDHQGPI